MFRKYEFHLRIRYVNIRRHRLPLESIHLWHNVLELFIFARTTAAVFVNNFHYCAVKIIINLPLISNSF